MAGLSKQHFQAIADVIANVRSRYPEQDARLAVMGIERELAAYFTTQNPSFDRARFIEACEAER